MTSSAFGQYQFSNRIELTGTVDGARTVHFSDDGTSVFGDWNELTQWDIESKSIVKSSPIAGYNTYKSIFDGQSTWMNANINYNTEKKDFTDTHPNLNIINSEGSTANKISQSLCTGSFIPGTKDLITIAFSKKHTYTVVRFSTETFEKSTEYFDEIKDGAAVPTAIKVSEDGKTVAVSMAGENSGIRIYGITEGNLIAFIPTKSDVNDLAFSQNGAFIYANNGSDLIQVQTIDWTQTNSWKFEKPITTLDVNSTGKHIAVAFQNAGAILLESETGETIAELSTGKVSDITFSNDDKYIGLGIQKTLNSDKVAAVILYQID
jgi:hypothetical protein